MSDAQPRLFLERASYRRRRWIDAARLLPFAGLFLWLIPLVWPSAGAQPGLEGTAEGALDAGGTSLALASIYMFVIWFVLIVAGAVVSRKVDFGADVNRSMARTGRTERAGRTGTRPAAGETDATARTSEAG